MRTIVTESSRLPDPASYFPTLVVKNWSEKRIKTLEEKTDITDSESLTLKRLKGIDFNAVMMEPPVIIDDKSVKVCILSREVGTLWLDEPVPRVTFEEFLNLAFNGQIPFSNLEKETPYTVAELEALIKDEKTSAPIPGFIRVLDKAGVTRMCIIGDVLTEETVNKEKLFGKYTFEKATTKVYGYAGDNRPTYPFTGLEDFCVAITDVEDTLLVETSTIYSISINALKGLIADHDAPPVIVNVQQPAGQVIPELDVKSDYVIAKGALITFDKEPTQSTLVVKSLVDNQGNIIAKDDFTVRIIATDDPKVQSLEVGLVGYLRRFFAADAIGRTNGFKLTVNTVGGDKDSDVTIPVTWELHPNTFNVVLNNKKESFADITKLPLSLSLISREGKVVVSDLTPLKMPENPQDIFNTSVNYLPVMVDGEYVLGDNDGVPAIVFNTKLNAYGLVALSFADKRIIDYKFFVVDPAETFTPNAVASLDSDKKVFTADFTLTTPYTANLSAATLVIGYEGVSIKLNDIEMPNVSTKVDPTTGNTKVTFDVGYEGAAENLKWELTGNAICGVNEHPVPFSFNGTLNAVARSIKSAVADTKVTLETTDGEPTVLTTSLNVETSLNTITVDDLVISSVIDGLGEDVTSKATVAWKAIDDTHFTGTVSLAKDYTFPFAFKDADNMDGKFTVGVKLKDQSNDLAKKVEIIYGHKLDAGSITPVVSELYLTNESKDNTVMRVRLYDKAMKSIDRIIAPVIPAAGTIYGTEGDNPLTYNNGINVAVDGEQKTVLDIKTKFDHFGNFVLSFKDAALKTAKSSIADPKASYKLIKQAATIQSEGTDLTFKYALNKDDADYTIADAKLPTGKPTIKVNGADVVPAVSWTFNNITPAVLTLTYSVGNAVKSQEYDFNTVLSIGANKVPVALVDKATIERTDSTPGMVDGNGNPVPDGSTNINGKPTLSGKDMKPGSTVTVKEGDKVLGTATVDANGNWKLTIDPALENGKHTLDIDGTDKDGNPSNKTVDVVVDVAKPGTGIIDGNGNPVDPSKPNIDGKPILSGKEMKPGSLVTIKEGDNTLGTAKVADDGTWSYFPNPALSNGEHTLDITGTDRNDQPVADQVKVIVDVTNPNISGDDKDNTGKPTLSGQDMKPGSKVVIKEGDKTLGEATVDAEGEWTYTVDPALTNGKHTLTITGKDRHDTDVSKDVVITVDVANTTPGITDKDGTPVAEGSTTTDSKPVLSGQDMKPGSKVSITDNGKKIGEATVGEDGTWSYTPDPALANGEHVIVMDGKDKHDADTSKTITITVDAPSDGGGDDMTDEEKALADPTEGGKYSGPGDAGFGGTVEPTADVSNVIRTFDLTATPVTMYIPYVSKGAID